MGDIADWMVEQMLDSQYMGGDGYYYHHELHTEKERLAYRIENAEQLMEEFNMANTFSFDINSEKKVYRIKPPEARGSFMSRILVPEAFSEGDTPEYGCQLRWPMDSPEVKEWAGEMGAMFVQMLTDKFGEAKAQDMIKNPQLKIPLRNGNLETNDEYANWLFMNVRNKFRQPIVMGPHAKAIPVDLLNDSVIYSGAWYRTRLVFSYFDVKSKGIGAYIEILMKTRDDDRLDNVVDVGQAEGEFGEFATADAGMDDIAKPEEADASGSFDFL